MGKVKSYVRRIALEPAAGSLKLHVQAIVLCGLCALWMTVSLTLSAAFNAWSPLDLLNGALLVIHAMLLRHHVAGLRVKLAQRAIEREWAELVKRAV